MKTRDDPLWWLPLACFKDNCRAHIAALRSRGVVLTWQGIRRVYRQARQGVVYVKSKTFVPAHLQS